MEDDKYYNQNEQSDTNIIRHLIKIEELLGGGNKNDSENGDDQ